MTKTEINKLKKNYKHICAVFKIVQNDCAKLGTTKWDKHPQQFHMRAGLRKLKKEYGEKLIEIML